MSPGEFGAVPPELKALEDIIDAGTLMVKRETGGQLRVEEGKCLSSANLLDVANVPPL